MWVLFVFVLDMLHVKVLLKFCQLICKASQRCSHGVGLVERKITIVCFHVEA